MARLGLQNVGGSPLHLAESNNFLYSIITLFLFLLKVRTSLYFYSFSALRRNCNWRGCNCRREV